MWYFSLGIRNYTLQAIGWQKGRDESNKKHSSSRKKGDAKGSRQLLCAEQEERVLEKRRYGNIVENRGVMRVKVKMTKEEAARLMSKCKEGRVLGFMDVANELVQLPVSRVSIVSCGSGGGGFGGVLESIPEES
ncbi:hypothetical protein Tsubulata_013765 [Turnera subulata]|uniref:DUF7890 domain-containing protein n=1 Tax=Turnera subulata TaxID=218843 RepID=A0A9Q0FEJ4_9ROSI|nr:hypothetical protein Tsubulata_013765 [Turnera subulata]